jgi:hypothetical protein
MNNAISEKLLSHIKTILSDEPLDIYFEYSESYSTSIVELVNSRTSEFQKTVGSANMLIASSILNYELTELGLQEEDYSDVFAENWHKVIETLKEQGFLRDTPETVREGIYLAVDNATPIEGCKNSCLNKGENNDECTIE